MEVLFEILGEIFFEGIIEVIKNKRISKWIRYPLFVVMNVFYLALFGIMFIICINSFLKKEILGGMVVLFIAILFLILYICFLRKLIKKKEEV